MRRMRGAAAGAMLALACAAGCELVTGFTGTLTIGNPQGTGGGAPPTCTDAIKQCGGECPPCPDGQGCKSGSDCADKVCSAAGVCLPPSCSDMVQNGDETDVDCGGSTCPPCAFGKGCKSNGDCVTGFCNGKTCDAQTLVSGLTNPNSLAATLLVVDGGLADGGAVYWADGDDGTIMQADLATLTSTQVVGGRTGPQGLVTSFGLLAWVEPEAGNVMLCNPQAVPAAIPPVGTTQSPSAVAINYIFAAWTSPSELSTDTGGDAGIAGFSGPGGKIAIAPEPSLPCAFIVYSPDNALGTFGGGLQVVPYSFAIFPPPDAGPCPSGFALPAGIVAGLAVDATFAYWTDGATDGNVTQAALTPNSSPAIIAAHQTSPSDIAVDATNAYWINQGTSPGTGAVMKAPLAGGGVRVVLASGQDTPRGLFVLGNVVYWLTGAKGQGAVKMIHM